MTDGTSCPSDDALACFATGNLADGEASAVRMHLATCEPCRWTLDGVVDTQRDVATLNDIDDARRDENGDDAAKIEKLRLAHAAAYKRGDTIGRYIVIENIGEGGMGVVYTAYDPELDRRVALKLIHPGQLTDIERKRLSQRFLREARAIAKVIHENVVAVHDVGTIGESLYIAMEFVDGQTLRSWLAASKRSTADIVAIFIQAGRGLAAAHAAGLVHRDFKPDNVLIGRDGRVRVADFGLARGISMTDGPDSLALKIRDDSKGRETRDVTVGTRVTKTGFAVGTPAYMAPEQSDNCVIDARADQYSFCVALYEALFGERPRKEDTASTKRSSETVPLRIGTTLEQGLRKDPAQRFPTMHALLTALEPPKETKRSAVTLAIISAAVTVLIAVILVVRSNRATQLCLTSDADLSGAWDASVRERIERQLVNSGVDYAARAWRAIDHALGDYSRAWLAMKKESCEATRVRGTQSDEMLTLRNECLARRFDEFRALTTQLATADKEALANALTAADNLAPLDTCADSPLLRSAVRLPENATKRAEQQRIVADAARIRALEQLGKYTQVRVEAGALSTRAEALGHNPTLAEVLYLEGRILHRGGADPRGARTILYRAVRAAELGRHETLLADIWIELVGLVGGTLSDLREGDFAAARAGVAVERTGHPSSEYHAAVAEMAVSQGNAALAVRENTVALELVIAKDGAESVAAAEQMMALAGSLVRTGELERASDAATRALAIQESQLGTEHPDVAQTLFRLGQIHRARGDFAGGYSAFKRGLHICESQLSPDSVLTGIALHNMARALASEGKFDEALKLDNRTRAIFEKAFDANNFRRAQILSSIGFLNEQRGDVGGARAAYAAALPIAEASVGPAHRETASILRGLSEAARRENKLSEALGFARRALSIDEASAVDDSLDVARDLALMGEIELGSKLTVDARQHLERALRTFGARHATESLHNRAEFALAKVLRAEKKDRARAIELATSARDGFARGGAPTKNLELEVTKWLAEAREK